jgi:apolipoprotein D and lipocalin family protein
MAPSSRFQYTPAKEKTMTRAIPAVLALILLSGCIPAARPKGPPPTVVPRVDLARYAGDWYEIAKYPNRFQRGCDGATATYTLRPDGRVDVVNRCTEDGPERRERTVRGVAKVVDPATGAKLSVTFFWPFSGDYWILGLGDDYGYAVVGSPDRRFLWILSRNPEMPEALWGRVLEEVRRQGFDPGRLVRSNRPR